MASFSAKMTRFFLQNVEGASGPPPIWGSPRYPPPPELFPPPNYSPPLILGPGCGNSWEGGHGTLPPPLK